MSESDPQLEKLETELAITAAERNKALNAFSEAQRKVTAALDKHATAQLALHTYLKVLLDVERERKKKL